MLKNISVITLLLLIQYQYCFSKTIKEFILEDAVETACLDNCDTIFRPYIISQDLQLIYNLNDTIIVKYSENKETNKIIKTVFIVKFCEDKKTLINKFLKKNNKKCKTDLLSVSTLYGYKSNEDFIYLIFLSRCFEEKELRNKNIVMLYSRSTELIIKSKGNQLISFTSPNGPY